MSAYFLVPTPERTKIIDFTISIYLNEYVLLIPYPTPENDLNQLTAVLRPFSMMVIALKRHLFIFIWAVDIKLTFLPSISLQTWLCVLFTMGVIIVAMSLMMTYFRKIQQPNSYIYDKKTPVTSLSTNLNRNILYVLSTLFYHGLFHWNLNCSLMDQFEYH